MRLLGEIVRLQVQTASLKVPGGRFRAYDPATILPVPALALDDGGACGIEANGSRIADIHHRDHPDSKYRGENPLSIGLTGHYDLIRGRFGPAIVDGIAGENMLIGHDGRIDLDDLAWGVVIERTSGERIELEEITVAAPCVEFSRYVMGYPPDRAPDRTVTETLQFLHEGLRGFYARYTGTGATVQIGDRIFVR